MTSVQIGAKWELYRLLKRLVSVVSVVISKHTELSAAGSSVNNGVFSKKKVNTVDADCPNGKSCGNVSY
jgi:hypothetical protein